MQKQKIPEFLIQGKNQEGCKGRCTCINDFKGNI